MGLTIHANFKSNLPKLTDIRQIIKQMRNICLDLPFEEVTDIIELTKNDFIQIETDKNHKYRHLLFNGCEYIEHNNHNIKVYTTHYIGFSIWPGDGSEEMNIYLATYPKTINTKSKSFPHQNKRINTNLNGWHGHSFCKTQYASNPECGGIANFLKCHITLITALEKMKELNNIEIEIEIEDEGKYGDSTYSDDYQEAYKTNKKPTYVWHPGKHSPAELIKEIGEWNQMIAVFAGKLKDAFGVNNIIAPICNYPNFEYLEFKAHSNAVEFINKLAKIQQK